MGREKCWTCKKVKTGVQLRATDDRMCEACFQKNEEALKKLRAASGNTPSSSKKKSTADQPFVLTALPPDLPNNRLNHDGQISIDYCPVCHELTDSMRIHCDICDDFFHQECSGMSCDTFNVLLHIVSDSGWVCLSCRRINHDRFSSLQSALAKVTDELSDMRASFGQVLNEQH